MDPSRFWGSIRRLLNQAVVCSSYPFLWKFQQIGSSDQPDRRSNLDHVWFRTLLKRTKMLSDLSNLLPLLLLDQVALDCAQKQESAFTELGLAPKHDRFIACFSPLQTKACCAAEKVNATTLPIRARGNFAGCLTGGKQQTRCCCHIRAVRRDCPFG